MSCRCYCTHGSMPFKVTDNGALNGTGLWMEIATNHELMRIICCHPCPCSSVPHFPLSWPHHLLCSDFTSLCRYVGLPRFLFPLPPLHRSPCMIWSGWVLVLFPCMMWSGWVLVLFPCMIQSSPALMYDINLRATYTTILSIRGVTIPIYLVSSATDSIRRCIVLFKLVPISTSDPKSEFLCQSNLQLRRTYRPPWTPCTPGISPTPSSPCITHTVIALVLWLST